MVMRQMRGNKTISGKKNNYLRGDGTLANGNECAGGGAGEDGVLWILLFASVDHGAIEGGEETASDGEAVVDSQRVKALICG